MPPAGDELTIRDARDDDAAAIAAIYNEGIRERIATFETEERSAAERLAWLRQREPRYRVLVAERDGHVVAWAALSPYSSRACYSGVADHSIYVAASARGAGVGSALLAHLIAVAASEGFWKLTSRIFAFNQGSVALHRRAGFRDVGVNEKHAQLDGHWLDTITVEYLIRENMT